MEACSFLHSFPLHSSYSSSFIFHKQPSSISIQGAIKVNYYRGPKPKRNRIREWVTNNDALVRGLPIYAGGISLLAVLLNRALSGIAAVADASSSQSRADILTLALAVTDILTGLVWLSIRPKNIAPVALQGMKCKRINPEIPNHAACELLWAWETISSVTCCRSLVVVYKNSCLLQIGVAAPSPSESSEAMDVEVEKFTQGQLFQSVKDSGKQSYLANLSLYPGKSELPFLPANTQAVILQPLGDSGVAIIGGDTIRGFTSLDQAWISFIADKLVATLSKS